MIIEATVTAAPYLIPLASWILGSSLYGLHKTRVATAKTRVEPRLDPPPLPPAAALQPPAPPPLDSIASLPEIRRRMAPRLIVSAARSAEILIEFMNSENQTGYFTASEIDEWWAFAAAARDIERLSSQTVREALEGRGLRIGQRRLNAPEYLAVRQRTAQTRPVLYRIPRIRSQAGAVPEAPDNSRSDRQATVSNTGTAPAAVQRASQMEAA